MAVYLDAAKVLSGPSGQGSLKSRIYGPNADLRSKPAHVYALISECAKRAAFLKEVIDNADILRHEPKVRNLSLMSFASPLTDPAFTVGLSCPRSSPRP